MSKIALLFMAAVLAHMFVSTTAFFDRIGGGGGGSCGGGGGGGGGGSCGGGCGGGGAAEPEEDNAPAPPTVFPPSNVIYAFTGKSHTGKSFVAHRFGALLEAQQTWNISVVPISFADFVTEQFATESGLDAARLKTDYDYRDEHFAKMNKFSREYRAKHPMWLVDPALEWALAKVTAGAVKDNGQRRAFIFDDVQFRFQLNALEKLASANAPRKTDSESESKEAESKKTEEAQVLTALPNAELVTVRLTAPDEVRKTRGWRSGRVPSSAETDFDTLPANYWTKSFDNAGSGEDVVQVDNFLAQHLLRTIAK